MNLPEWNTYSRYIFVQRAHDLSSRNRYKYLYGELTRYNGDIVFSLENCLDFIQNLQDRGLSNHSINNFIKTIRNVCKWQHLDWGEEIAYKKKQRRAPRTLSIPQFKKILKYHPLRTRDTRRVNMRFDGALETAFVCGLRISELCNLRWEDVRPDALTIRDTKNNEDRVIPIPPHLYNRLMRLKQLSLSDTWVFGYARGKLSSDTIRTELHTRLKATGLKGTIKSMHDLRHSFATIMAAQDVNIMKLKDYLGHKDVSSTQIYVHLTAKHLKTIVDRNPYNSPTFDVVKQEVHELISRLKQFDIKVQLTETDSNLELRIDK